MPSRVLRPCTHPGCTTLVVMGRCDLHAAQIRKVYRTKAVQDLYNSKRWKALRAQVLSEQPFCADCARKSPPVRTSSTDVHHVKAHRGDESTFWDGPFEGLCHACHGVHTAEEINQRGRW